MRFTGRAIVIVFPAASVTVTLVGLGVDVDDADCGDDGALGDGVDDGDALGVVVDDTGGADGGDDGGALGDGVDDGDADGDAEK
ncbi:MAG: hypothetical protein NWE99_04880 [Candidatus Bathyarchaeota archaeon]|nr:hypothetical protein [Candidatus Bathyarchaeota archaeon]